MIFVTVGLHTQGFDRLIQEVDRLKGENVFYDEVIQQIGFSSCKPVNCKWKESYSFTEIAELMQNARIVITHGGPSSFLEVLKYGKVPIVVPRRAEFNEHINNHQVEFVNEIAERMNNIIVVNDIKELKDVIVHYDELIKNVNCGLESHNLEFCRNLEMIINNLLMD